MKSNQLTTRDRKLFKKQEQIRNLCLQNAKDFVESAKLLIDDNYLHIRYHLSALALEEIGKAELLEMFFVAELNSKENEIGESSIEKHVQKLFWAFWGPTFGRKVITKTEIKDLRDLASSVHLRRLETLYVKPTDTKLPRTKLSQEEVDRIMRMAEARLEMELSKKMLSPDDPAINKVELNWFLTVNKEPEKYKLIFGLKSQEKLIELGNTRDWIHWLKQEFDQNDEDMRKMVSDELARERPEGEEAKKLKFKIKVNINSESHSIRAKHLNEWNKHSDFVKLFAKDKSNLIIELYLTASTPAQALWTVGWGMIRFFVVALNIATRGIFWWHTSKDKSRYYEEMWDLQQNVKMGVELNPQLNINFSELHWVLNENQLLRTNLVFYYITKVMNDKKAIEPYNHYVTGLSFYAKNDIHLRFELNAYECFYKSLRSALLNENDWDGKSDFKLAVHKKFEKLGDFKDLDHLIDLGEELSNDPAKTTKTPITLTEIVGLKLYCDIYLELIAKRNVDIWKKVKNR